MLVILPRPKNSRHIYGFDLNSLTSVWIVYKDERNRVYHIIPASSSKILPLIDDFEYLEPHKVKLVKKPLSMKWVSAFTIKQRLLKSLLPFMIEEVQPRKPSSIFEAISSVNHRLHTYYAITYSNVYCCGSEPKNFKTTRLYINGPLVLFL